MSESCPVCKSPFTCGLSRTSHYHLYPLHEHGHASAVIEVKEDIILTENLQGKTRRRRKE
jgi:hypothetical protein